MSCRAWAALAFAIAFYIHLTSLFAIAEQRQRFLIEGLSFNCPECRFLGDDKCRISANGELLLLDCSNAVRYLLEDSVKGASESPSKRELLRFLLAYPQSPVRAELALSLLTEDSEGERFVINELRKLLPRYLLAFEYLVDSNRASEDLTRAVWDTMTDSDSPAELRLRVKIVSSSSELRVDDLVSLIKFEDFSQAMKVVAELRDNLAGRDTEGFQYFLSLEAAFKACNLDPISESCREYVLSLGGARAVYLNRFRVKRELSSLRGSDLPIKEKLTRISLLDYQRYRTPDLHLELRESLAKVQARDLLWMLESPYRELLEDFARSDPAIRKLIESLLRQAEISVSSKQYGEFIELFEIEPRRRSSRFLVVVLVSGGGLILLVSFALVLRRSFRRKNVISGGSSLENSLNPEERRELRELIRFFELEPRSTSKELQLCYRRKARLSHPDTVAGSAEAFTELQAKYERASALLRRGKR